MRSGSLTKISVTTSSGAIWETDLHVLHRMEQHISARLWNTHRGTELYRENSKKSSTGIYLSDNRIDPAGILNNPDILTERKAETVYFFILQ